MQCVQEILQCSGSFGELESIQLLIHYGAKRRSTPD